MKITIHILQDAQAEPLQPFILPEVWADTRRGVFWYFAATDGDELIGAAVIDPSEDGARLCSIAVSPDYRRQGIAGMMLDEAVRMLNAVKIPALWAEYVLPHEEWEALDGLLQTNGFAMIDEDSVYLASLSQLMQSSMLAGAYTSENVISLAEMSDLEKQHLYYALQEKMQIDGIILQECDPGNSLMWKTAEGITAAIFISPEKNGKLDILWMWLDTEAHNPKALMMLLATAAYRCNRTYPAETKVQFTCLTENSEQILRYFLPQTKPVFSMRIYLATTIAVS